MLKTSTDAAMTREMISILRESMMKNRAAGETRRGAHAKSHGLLKAQFVVHDGIPSELKVGIFREPKSYAALIRLSNSSASIKSDKQKDFRGFAIKLLGVQGDRDNLDEKQSQDFVLMSSPTMPLGTVKLFRDAIYYAIKWHPLVMLLKFLLSGHGAALAALRAGRKFDTSLLDIQYWSTTPYAFGERAVKYSVVPTSAFKSQLPNPLTDDYLASNTSNHLQNQTASFDFFVQFFDTEATTPIEDAAVEWTAANNSPFIKVATIQIPIQSTNNAVRNDLVETMSYSPAHSLAVHRPLGGLNIARTEIYKALSQFRHERNGKVACEPTQESFNSIE
ncbi:MAG: hypothetical protein WCK15_13255 [Pirellula sp.]